jgi:hypothetical protein
MASTPRVVLIAANSPDQVVIVASSEITGEPKRTCPSPASRTHLTFLYHHIIRPGYTAAVTIMLEGILGRRPTSFYEFVEVNAGASWPDRA